MGNAMTIEPFRNLGTSFDVPTVSAVSAAYDKAIAALHDRGQPAATREIIAKHIMALASQMMLEQERDNKLMNVGAALAAVAHEVNQPLTSIVVNGSVVQELLSKAPPHHVEAREVIGEIISGASRTSEIIDSVRALFRQAGELRQPTNVNEIILGVLRSVRGELQDRGLAQFVQLAPKLPLVPANRKQLHQVILNLVRNALEAMEGMQDRTRVLRVRTELRDGDAIAITVQDSGPGIWTRYLMRSLQQKGTAWAWVWQSAE